MRLVKAAKASPHAKFYNLSTATNPPVINTLWRLHTISLIAERQAEKLWIPIA